MMSLQQNWRIVFLLALISAALLPCVAQSPKPPQALQFTYTLKEGGQVSAAVYNAAGQMVRTLQYGEKQAPGTYTLSWDGLDRYGQPQPPGTYEWRILRTPGFTREFLVNLGVTTPWSPCDAWPGNHFGPSLVLMDDDDKLFVGTVSSEGPPALLQMSLDGSKKYWDTGTWGLADGMIGLARIGNVLYIQKSDANLWIRRADNGGRFYGDPVMGRFATDDPPFLDLLHTGDDRGKNKISPMSMTGGKDFLVVTYHDYNEVRVLWPEGEKIAREKTVPVPAPGAVTVAQDGRVFIVSGNDIIRLDVESGQSTPVVHDVPEQGKLAHDPQFDDLLVVSGGKCVRRYHVPDGKSIAVYGRPEGRIYGLFNPLDFDDILDITADRKGGFVTVEQYPRRVAHFTGREKHQLVAQWIGGMQWGSQVTIDPADPTTVYLPIDPKHLGRGKIDYKTRTWTLTHLYDMIDHGSWSVGAYRFVDILPYAGERVFWNVRHIGGQTFLYTRGGGGAGGILVVRVDEQANRLMPVAYLGNIHPSEGYNNPPEWYLQAAKLAGFSLDHNSFADFTKHFAYSWSDTNRNGKVDIEEIKLGSVAAGVGVSSALDANWNIIIPNPLGNSAWQVLKNEGTVDLPIWNWDHRQPGAGHYNPTELADVQPESRSLYCDGQGNISMVVDGQGDNSDGPPANWPNWYIHSSRFLAWNGQGQQLFSTGVHTGRKDGAPGMFSDVRAVLGEINNCLVVMDACSPASVWTRDGLYAGSFLDARANDGLPDTAYTYTVQKVIFQSDDNQWGQILKNQQGDVLWCRNAAQSTYCYKMTGWDGWGRQQGKLALKATAPTAQRQGTGLSAEYFANPDLAGEPVLKRVDKQLNFGQLLGDHTVFPAGPPWFTDKDPAALKAGPWSARWTGVVEAPVSEDFIFRAYVRVQNQDKALTGARVRVWLAGKLIIDQWDGIKLAPVTGYVRSWECSSAPCALTAGQRVPIKIELASPGSTADDHLHLYWNSLSFDLRHVPKVYLYPLEAMVQPAPPENK